MFIDKKRPFIERRGALRPIKAEPKTMKNTLAGDVGAAMSPPRGLRGRAPTAYVVISFFSSIRLSMR